MLATQKACHILDNIKSVTSSLREVMPSFCFTLCRPYLEYYVQFCGYVLLQLKMDVDLLERVQRKALEDDQRAGAPSL